MKKILNNPYGKRRIKWLIYFIIASVISYLLSYTPALIVFVVFSLANFWGVVNSYAKPSPEKYFKYYNISIQDPKPLISYLTLLTRVLDLPGYEIIQHDFKVPGRRSGKHQVHEVRSIHRNIWFYVIIKHPHEEGVSAEGMTLIPSDKGMKSSYKKFNADWEYHQEMNYNDMKAY